MNILLDDLPFNDSLYPFGAVKSMVHIRIGILTIFEKWQLIFPGKVFISSCMQRDAETSAFNKIPANIIPSADFLKEISKEKTLIPSMDDCKILQYPWQIFEYNDWAIRQDFELITEGRKSKDISSTNQLIGAENIFAEEGAIVNYSILNATEGPIYIGKNAC